MRIRIIKSGLAQSVEQLEVAGLNLDGSFLSLFFFFFFFSSSSSSFSFIIVILINCKVDYKVFIIRNNIHVLIYLSRMKSCLWGWSCYHYSLAQRPISHRIHIFLATLSMMQVRHLQTQLINIQLKNRLHVHMVCEWAWVSIPGDRDLPKSLNLCSPLELRSHAQVRTHAHTQANASTYSLMP